MIKTVTEDSSQIDSTRGPGPKTAPLCGLRCAWALRRLTALGMMTLAWLFLPQVLLAAEDAPEAIGGSGAGGDWFGVLKEHQSGLLVAGAVLAGILLFSAVILAVVVRRTKLRAQSEPEEAPRPGPTFSPRMKDSRMLGAPRGAQAFAPKGGGKPARSGDTTRLTLDEELAAVEDEPPASSAPHPATFHGAGLWAILFAWICLIAGVAVMWLYPGSYATCAPLLLGAVLLAVTAMTQRMVLQGSLVLAALYITVPSVWLTQYLAEDATPERTPQASLAGSTIPTPVIEPPKHPTPEEVQQALGNPRKTPAGPPAYPIAATPPKSSAPPSVWRQVLPGGKLADPQPGTTATESPPAPQPSMLVPDMPPPPSQASGAVFGYRARLSHSDHFDAQGNDLRNSPKTTFGDILLQERLHVHQGGRRDPEDTVDTGFANLPLHQYRALFKGKEVQMGKNLLLFQLLKDDIIVDVQVFQDHLKVDLVSTRE